VGDAHIVERMSDDIFARLSNVGILMVANLEYYRKTLPLGNLQEVCTNFLQI
jgi:hypothetical protein